MKMIPVSKLKLNDDNPRKWSDLKLEQLKRSIDTFKKMMAIRPIIVDEDDKILGGNFRFSALLALGYTEVPAEWVKRVEGLTEEEKREFIIKDNLAFGEWDWSILEQWDREQLEEWGLDIPSWVGHDVDPDQFFVDSDREPKEEEEGFTITLNYSEEEGPQVKEALLKISKTPEDAVWKLLGL